MAYLSEDAIRALQVLLLGWLISLTAGTLASTSGSRHLGPQRTPTS